MLILFKIQLFFTLYNQYKKIDDEDFQSKLERSKELLVKKVIKKSEEQESLYTDLPYSMRGSTQWKKLARYFM
jgi:hypothetical protein